MPISEPLGRRQLALWIGVGVALAVCKLAYGALLPLAWAVPAARLGGRRQWWGCQVAFVLGVALVGGGWGLAAGHLFEPHLETPGVDPAAQLAHIIGHPAAYFSALGSSIALHAADIAEMWIGVLGCTDAFMPPAVYDSFDFVLLAIALAQGLPTDSRPVRAWHRALWVGLFAVGSVGVFTFLYLAWNPVASEGIIGVHGRYFIPLAPLLFLLPTTRGGVRGLQPFLPVAGLWALGLALLAARAVWIRFW